MLVEIVSPEQSFFSGEASLVISRTPDGEIGILEGHEPTVATLVPGGLTVDFNGDRTSYAISGGVLQITKDKVLVLGETIEKFEGSHEDAVQKGLEIASEEYTE
jgi:F-type H+-transporting ATPase subunit epsilon